MAEAIKEWVSEGGTLLLGGGVRAGEVLEAFAGNIINCKAGKTIKINTDFCATEKN